MCGCCGEVARPIVVVAAPGQDVPPLPAEVAIVRDEEQGRGPLQGLAAGLQALAGQARGGVHLELRRAVLAARRSCAA